MNDQRSRPRHPIQVAARRAGLNPALLRAWERRYNAVAPSRSETRQRLYSDTDVERLRRLRMVTEAGRRISNVAALTDNELSTLLGEDDVIHRAKTPHGISGRPSLDDLLERSLARVRDRDERGLRRELERAVLLYDPLSFLDEVLGALVERVGEASNDGRIDPSHGHVSNMVARTLLEDLLVRLEPDRVRARIAVAIPAGERHELGGFAMSVALAVCGCEAIRLGAELPPATVARSAHDHAVDAVAVAATGGADSRRLGSELATLRQQLGPEIPMLVGGWGSRRVRTIVDELGATLTPRLQDLPDSIDRMLSPAAHSPDPGVEDVVDQSIAS